jgi:hypothetical protein
MAFPLFALLLFAGQPVVTTARTQAPAAVSAPVSTAGADLTERPVDRDALPQGAPADDYRFVAWCDGVLAGHMDIAERVKDVLPIDDVQQKIGKSYLRAYVRALDGAPQAKTEEGRQAAEAARLDGFNKWEQARNADHKLAAESYLSYQLPPRCEHAALRLSHNPNLFKSTPSADQVATVSTGARRVADPNASGAATKGLLFSPNKPAPVANLPAATETVAAVAAPQPMAAESLKAEPKSPAPSPGAGAAVLPSEPAVVAETAPAPSSAVSTAAVAPAVAKTSDKTPEKVAAKTTDKPAAKKPKRGHLLPPFLRKKDPDEQ